MKKLKKVLYVCSVYKPNIGGVETIIDNISSQLEKYNIDSSVLTKRFPYDLPATDSDMKTRIVRMDRPKTDQEFIESIKFIKKHLSILDADIIHQIGVRRPMSLYALLLSKLWKVPYLITYAGGDLPDKDELPSLDLWKEGTGIVPQSLSQADNHTAFSEYTATLSKKTLNISGVGVIPAGVDIKTIQKIPKHEEKYKYFFSARRLDASKGIDILIRAFSRIVRRLHNVKLLIAGEGVDEDKLKKLVKELRLTDSVVFLGPLKHEEVISYMKGAIAHICPSRTESGGVVNFEAIASGCLPIGSNAGGIPEYIDNKKTGLVFSAGSVKDLADKMLYSALNANDVEKMKYVGRKRIKNISMEKFVETYSNLYVKLVNDYTYKPFISWSDTIDMMWKELNNEN